MVLEKKQYNNDASIKRLRAVLPHTHSIFQSKWIDDKLYYAYAEIAANYAQDMELKWSDFITAYVEDLEAVATTLSNWHFPKDNEKLHFFTNQLKKWLTMMNKQRTSKEGVKKYEQMRRNFFSVLFAELGKWSLRKEFIISESKKSILQAIQNPLP